jgi:hypothetical protein
LAYIQWGGGRGRDMQIDGEEKTVLNQRDREIKLVISYIL